MPIRLNLLAEQQEAEEARRRDPVKRAYWAAGMVVGLVVLWSGYLQLKLFAAKAGAERQLEGWRRLEPNFLQVSNQNKEIGLIAKKLDSLDRYRSNRFLWSHAAYALQHTTDERVRVVTLAGANTFVEQKEVVFSTNIFVILPAKSWWKLWSSPFKTNVLENAQQLLGTITNQPMFALYQPVLMSSLLVTTNPVQIAAKIDVIKPETIAEKISLTLRARDYSLGQRVDPFFAAVTNNSFFKQYLSSTNSTVATDGVQPTEDRTDWIHRNVPYLPFTIESTFPERIRANE